MSGTKYSYKGVEEALKQIGYSAAIRYSNYDISKPLKHIEKKLNIQYNGIFDTEEIIRLNSIKEVIIGGWFSYLSNINELAAETAAKRLNSLGINKFNIKDMADKMSGDLEEFKTLRNESEFRKRNAFNEALLYSKKTGMSGARAKFILYQMYVTGEGCKLDLRTAYKWLVKSAEENYPDANFILAEKYISGDNFLLISKDENKAYEHYKKASMLYPPQNTDFLAEKRTGRLNKKIISKKGGEIANTGNPVAQLICAEREFPEENLTLENLYFSKYAAQIASGIYSDPNSSRYYKAEIKYQFYVLLEIILVELRRNNTISENNIQKLEQFAEYINEKEKKAVSELLMKKR